MQVWKVITQQILQLKLLDSSAINIDDVIINTAITEAEIEFQQPPGSNGETKFYDVIRLMLPSVNGVSLRQLIDQGELSFEFEDAILSDWNPEKLSTVVYIQNSTTKEVYQAGSSFNNQRTIRVLLESKFLIFSSSRISSPFI